MSKPFLQAGSKWTVLGLLLMTVIAPATAGAATGWFPFAWESKWSPVTGVPSFAGGQLKLDSTSPPAGHGPVSIHTNANFDRRPVRLLGLREVSSRAWIVSCVTPDRQTGLCVRHDAAGDDKNLYLDVSIKGVGTLHQVLVPNFSPSPTDKFDLILDWVDDHRQLQINKNGVSILPGGKSITIENGGDGPGLYIYINCYAGSIITVDRVEAGPLMWGYLPSVWSSSAVPPTLAKIQSRRPASLPAGPNGAMASWVADRLARDSGASPSPAEVQAGLDAFTRQDGFYIRNDRSGVWVSNGEVGLAFLPGAQGGAIASLYNIPHKTECILTPPPPSTPWRLRVEQNSHLSQVRCALPPTTPVTAAPYVQDIEGTGASLAADISVKTTADLATIVLTWTKPVTVQAVAPEKGGDGFAVSATVKLTAAGSPTASIPTWRATVTHPQGTSFRLFSLMYPLVRGLGATGENDLMFSVYGRGRGDLLRGFQGWSESILTYPHGGWQLQYASWSFGPDTSLYWACHDPKGYTKVLQFMPGPSVPGDLKTGISFTEHVAWDKDNLDLPYDVALGVVPGDWYDAARHYRSWAVHQPWCARTLHQRVLSNMGSAKVIETDLWDQAVYHASNFFEWGAYEIQADEEWFWEGKVTPSIWIGPPPVTATNQKALFKPNLGIWYYGWNKEEFDTKYPNFTPKTDGPLGGAAAEFAKEGATPEMTIMPFTDCHVWDVSLPTFTKAVEASLVKNSDLTYSKLGDPGLVFLCMSTPLFRDTAKKLAVELQGYGANAIYYDTLPGVSDCWDPNHHHTPGAGGYWNVTALRTMLETVKKACGQSFGITFENGSEPLMDLLDAHTSWGFVSPDDAPLWPSIYGGYAVISGSRLDDVEDDVSYRMKIGHAFLWGSQLARSLFAPYFRNQARAVFTRNLACLKAQTRDYLLYGDMQRPPAWETVPSRVTATRWVDGDSPYDPLNAINLTHDAVESSLWKKVDSDTDLALFVVNYSDRDQTASFNVSPAVFTSGTKHVQQLTAFKSPQSLPDVQADGSMSVTVPANDAVVLRFYNN